MKIYLSKPGFICACGDNVSQDVSEEFTQNIFSGNAGGIVKIKCSLKNNDSKEGKSFYAGKISDSKLKQVQDKFDSRFIQILDYALEGVRGSVVTALSKYGTKRVAVCVGQCDNGSFLSLNAYRHYYETGAYSKEYDIKAQGADYAATYASHKFGLEGPSLAFATACSSGAGALVKAAELIKAGLADAAVAGGADIASDTVLLGFDSLEAVSKEKTNPFSKNRSGITLGEGAAFFVLSREPLSEDEEKIILSGYGESSDASHMTAPLADGSGAKAAMEGALQRAGLNPKDIGYVNLHGTGTRLNDSMEAKALNSVFKDYKVPCSTTKPLMGHTLGAAGALEGAVCYYTLKKQELPVQVWDKQEDDAFPPLNIVSSAQKADGIVNCMSNSFAFGGCNVSLILSKEGEK